MYRSICIVYYLLYTINKETTHYSHYIMYYVSSCNRTVLIYYIK